MKNEEEETHPYNLNVGARIPESTSLLIVGTAPPPRFSYPRSIVRGPLRPDDVDYYYGSDDNYMWEFMENIAGEIGDPALSLRELSPEKCPNLMRDFLQRKNFWMRDVLQRYQRKPGKETSPADADIVRPIPEFTDFRPIFSESSLLNAVAFTSEQAAAWTFEALHNQGLITPEVFEKPLTEWRNIDKDLSLQEYIAKKYNVSFLRSHVGQRDIEFYLLPSPTARAAKKGLTVVIKQNIYRDILFGR